MSEQLKALLETPSARKAEAERIVNESFGEQEVTKKTNLQSLSELVYDEWCPGWRGDDSASFAKEEPTQERTVVTDQDVRDQVIAKHFAGRPSWNNPEFHDQLSHRISAKIGTPYTIATERDVCRRMTWMTASCNRCEALLSVGADDEELTDGTKTPESMADFLCDQVLQCRQDGYFEVGDCTCVDGLTEEECLERYTMLQRDFVPPHGLSPRDCLAWLRNNQLTVSQLEAGANAWSRSLREKQEQARQKERAEVVCDDDRWEP